MTYSMDILKQHLGKDFNPDGDYLIATHRAAAASIAARTHKKAGEVPDSTEDQNGTMIVLEVLPPPKPAPSPKIEKPKPSTVKPVIPPTPKPPVAGRKPSFTSKFTRNSPFKKGK